MMENAPSSLAFTFDRVIRKSYYYLTFTNRYLLYGTAGEGREIYRETRVNLIYEFFRNCLVQRKQPYALHLNGFRYARKSSLIIWIFTKSEVKTILIRVFSLEKKNKNNENIAFLIYYN